MIRDYRLAVCSTAVLLLLGCGSPEPHRSGGRYGGVFQLNESEQFRSIFPLDLFQANAWRVLSQCYQGLVRFDPSSLEVRPGLATSWEVSEDGTEWTFHLRSGVRFHDDPAFAGGKGRELRADDVVACFRRICSPGPRNESFWLLKDVVQGAMAHHNAAAKGTPDPSLLGVEALDERTVRIRLDHPSPGFLGRLGHSGCWIYPQELLDSYGKELHGHAIGTGPFKLRHISPGGPMVLERWNGYWDKDANGDPLPYLDAIRVTFEDDKQAEFAAFMSGALTMVDEVPARHIGAVADTIDPRTGALRYRAMTMASMSVQYYGFNPRMEPFNDPKVRKAFAMAIDRSRLVDSVLSGLAMPADHGLVPPGTQGYPYELVRNVPYAPQEARRLLAEAGYPGGRGFPTVVLQINNDGFGYVPVAEAVQEMLAADLGVGITVSVLPATKHYERIESGGSPIWRAGWSADHPDPENFLAILDSRNAEWEPGNPAGLNTTRYINARFDSLYHKAALTREPSERYRLLAEAEAQAMADMPLLPMYHDRCIWLVQPQVRGISLNPMELLDLSGTWFERTTAPAQGA